MDAPAKRLLVEAAKKHGLICLELTDGAASPRAAIACMASQLVARGLLDEGLCASATERATSKAYDGYHLSTQGCVLLLVGVPTGQAVIGGLAFSSAGIPWESQDGIPVHCLCLLFMPQGLRSNQGLPVAEEMARALRRVGAQA